MNDTIRTLLNHKTIRKFKPDSLPEETLQILLDAAIHTATSRGIQNASIIRVKDPNRRKQLADISKQSYTALAPEYLMFIVDLARPLQIMHEKGASTEVISKTPTMDVFREGFTDAVLMVQSTVVAAESLGLGTTILGSILNDPAATIKTLNLPKYTFPALGLLLGYPDQEPELKPRISQKLRVMTDTYQSPDSWIDSLTSYDQEMNSYYDLRKDNMREDTYTDQIMQKIGNPDPRRARLLEDIAAQGFLI